MRYFIIFYMFNVSPDRSYLLFGSTRLKQERFPNKQKIERSLGEAHNKEFVHIINILEVTETDYNDW